MEVREKILVTGGAGFIGSILIDKLLAQGFRVVSIDNYDPFYPKAIKVQNQEHHFGHPHFSFIEGDMADFDTLNESLPEDISVIMHLGAKAGVRPSIKAPLAYQRVNVNSTQNLLEIAKKREIKQFIFASSSSVYGINPQVPWRESDHVLLPISPYASTKISSELLGHVYSHLYGIRFIALRFFTVYGPRQRPDLAIHKFAKKILAGETLPIFGDGSTRRDYTFVEDIVQGLMAALHYDTSLYEIINLGNNQTVGLMEMLRTLEKVFDKEARLEHLPMQPGDVPQTYADISKAESLLGYNPQTPFEEGISRFKSWMEAQAILDKKA